MRDRGGARTRPPKRKRRTGAGAVGSAVGAAAPPRVSRDVLESPIQPPPRRPTTRERKQGAQIEHVLTHATQTGRALSPAESRRAVSKYGFLAANAIELGLRRLAEERATRNLVASGAMSHNAVLEHRRRGLTERVSRMGVLPDTGAFARAVNLVTSVPRDAAAIGIGLGQLAGRGGYDVTVDTKNLLTGGDPTFAHTRGTAATLARGTVESYRQRYGAGFQEELANHPLGYFLDVVGGAGAATRAGSVLRGAAEARGGGLSPLESIRQGYRKSVNPIDPRLAFPGHARTLPLGTRNIPLSWSRSPIGRYFQRLADDASLSRPNAGMFVTTSRSGIPIVTRGAKTRAARRAVRLERGQERRVRVAQARNMARIRHPAGRFRGSKAADIRLFWESNLPEQFRGNAGLQAVRDYLERQRNSPRRVRDLEPTAKLVEARARHERLQRRYDKAVGANKQRIAKELDKAGADMRAAEDSVAVITRRNEQLAADPVGSVERARARLTQVEATIEEALQGIEKDMKAQMGGKFTPEETMRRTKYRQEALGKKGKRAQARAKLEESHYGGKTQKQELRDHAWDQLHRYAERNDDVGRTVKAWLDEHDQLRDLIDAHEEKFLFKAPEDDFFQGEPAAAEKVSKAEAIRRQPENIPANLGRGKYGTEAGRLGGALSVSADELQRLEASHLRRLGQSRDQLQRNLDELYKQIHRAGEGTKTRAALEERAARLQSTLDVADQYTAARGYLAHEQLGRRIEELDQAMQHTPDDRYHGALAAAEAMTADLESITGEVLGPEKIGILEQRRGLLGRMIGLPEDTPASSIFSPHRETRTAGRIRDTAGIGAPRGRRIAGKASPTQMGLSRQNRGILVETGRVDPNLDHLIVQWGRAQSWRFVQNIRDLMYDAGDEIPVGSTPRPGWYVVDRKSRANEQLWENAEIGDDESLYQGLEDYVNNSIWREGEKAPATYQDMRQVDPTIVESIFRAVGVDLPGKSGRLRQSLQTGGAPFDVVNGLVRTSLLYANPGYYPANFIGNLVFMGLHQGAFALPNLLEAGTSYFKNRELFDRISGEVGMGPTEALSARPEAAGGRIDRALNIERRATHVAAAIPDNWPRVAAWYHEAKSAGLKTPEAMAELLTATDETSTILRQQISDRAVEAMVNFERTSPLERSTLGRVFFVWPWIRGATAWTKHYMTEYPERTAAIAPVATEENRRDKLPYAAGLPAYLENLVPLNKLGSRVLNVGAVSPSATAAQLVQTFAGTVNSAVNDVPPPKYQGLGDMTNPLLDFIWNTLHSQDTFGTKMGLRSAVLKNAIELSPLTSTMLQATGRQPVSKIYTDDSAQAVLARRWARVLPFGVDPQAIAERAKADDQAPPETPESRMDDWLAETRKYLGEPNEAIRRARRNQMLYEDAASKYKEKRYGSSKHAISDREEAAVLLSVDASQFAARWDPAVLSQRQQDIRTGSPEFVRTFIRDERRILWEQIVGKVDAQKAAAKRRAEDKAYARSHGG